MVPVMEIAMAMIAAPTKATPSNSNAISSDGNTMRC